MCAYFLVYHLNVINPASNRRVLLRAIRHHAVANTWDLPTWDGTV